MTPLVRLAALVLVVLPAAAFAQAPAVDARQQRIAEIRDAIAPSVANLEQGLAKPNPTPSTRDLPNAALAVFLLDQPPAKAQKFLEFYFAQQDMDPQSPAFGDVPWQVGHPEVQDRNSIEFGMQAMGPILLDYRDRLPEAFRATMVQHLRAAVAAVRRHKVKASYTNIFLMKAVNLVLLGQVTGDAPASADGRALLDEWLAYTKQAGIHEFASNTYYAVDLHCAGLGYRYAADAEIRGRCKRILDYLWTDLAVNYFPGRGALAGPNSRNYSFLTGSGYIDHYLYVEGLCSNHKVGKPGVEVILLVASLSGDGNRAYRPDAKILDWATFPMRTVLSRWDAEPGRDRYHCIAPDFAIGSASADYGPQDKLITLEFGTAKPLFPTITLIPDVFDAPYGLVKTPDRSGHNKPTHLPLSPTTVQAGSTLLVLLDLDPGAPGRAENPGSLATNVLLPARAGALAVDGAPVDIQGPLDMAMRLNSVVGVREGRAAAAVRVFAADGCAGQTPALALKADEAGLKVGAARLAVYHYRGPATTLQERHVRVGVLFTMQVCVGDGDFTSHCQYLAAAKVQQHSDPGRWEVKVEFPNLTLEAGRDLEHRKNLYRRVNGEEMRSERLMVNGEDLAKGLLGP